MENKNSSKDSSRGGFNEEEWRAGIWQWKKQEVLVVGVKGDD